MSVASFHLSPTLRQTTAYLAVISCGGWLFDLRLTVPISRAAPAPNASTSMVVNFASPICCAACRQKASIAARPLTISAPGGSTKASSVYIAATAEACPLLKAAAQASLSFTIVALSWADAGAATRVKQPAIIAIRHIGAPPVIANPIFPHPQAVRNARNARGPEG